MDMQENFNGLKQVSFSRFLTEDEHWYLLNTCKCISLETGEALFSENDVKESMYIVLKGIIEVYKPHKHIAFREAGEYLGEMSLLESKPRSASARATADSIVLEIDQANFKDLIAIKA
jgi:CRP-like cAMP-binding protein